MYVYTCNMYVYIYIYIHMSCTNLYVFVSQSWQTSLWMASDQETQTGHFGLCVPMETAFRKPIVIGGFLLSEVWVKFCCSDSVLSKTAMSI